MEQNAGENLPSAIIFHISRCGSTLLSQLLSLTEQSIVLSEVPFIDELLRLCYSDNEYGQTEIADFLTAALKFYGQKRYEQEKYLFIKTDSWHIFY
ncbi:hypothetical protein [Rubrolithibacter danxiaensis]|uniref:hypothetical protein n=1 Tax=Rubrolithibacter danxiaensis TaxID=3390805 RepID=UPI003BF81734